MRISAKARFAAGVPLLAAGLWTTMAMGSPYAASTAAGAPECMFTIDDLIPIGPEPVTVSVKFSQVVGDSLSAQFPEDSYVRVMSIGRGRQDGPLSATMVLGTERGVAGAWDVTVRGDKAICTGKVMVGPGKNPVAAKPAAAKDSTHGRNLSAPKSRVAPCAVFIDDSIPAGKDRAEVAAKLSEPVGDMITARFPKAAGIDVITAKRRPGDEPQTVRLTLNTIRATPGNWKLEVAGDAVTCSGMVYVGRSH